MLVCSGGTFRDVREMNDPTTAVRTDYVRVILSVLKSFLLFPHYDQKRYQFRCIFCHSLRRRGFKKDTADIRFLFDVIINRIQL